MKNKKVSIWKKILIGIVSLVLILGIAMVAYTLVYYHSTKTLEQYAADATVNISQQGSIITVANDEPNGTGIIFYPGAKVEYTAYIPLMEKLAESGYTCYIQKMPGNLAIFGINKAENIINNTDNNNIDIWYIAGHSLGGAMASSYAAKNSEKLAGIIFLGAYPAYDLSSTSLNMLSIIGSNDGVLNRESYESAKSFAPDNATYDIIEGGNHAYYGDYGEQKGDGTATITRQEQIDQAAELIIKFCQK